MSLEKVMVNELFDYAEVTGVMPYGNRERFLLEFTGISKDLFYYTSPETNFEHFNNAYNRVSRFVPQIFDRSELNILKGTNDLKVLEVVFNFARNYRSHLNSTKPIFIESNFDEIYKLSPTIEILKDKLVEIINNEGLKDFYLLNFNKDLNNLGTKTVQIFLANEKVKSDKEQYIDSEVLNLDENDFLWRLFKVKDDVYLVLTFRDVKALNITFPSFLDYINGFGNFEKYPESSLFLDNWRHEHFTSKGIYMSPKNQDSTNKIFLEPKLCLYFFKLKTVN
jgi:hypothetical protein